MNMQTKQKHGGFTLIELMIVVAVVGILSVVALPAYRDYTIRAKMAEPMAVLAEARTGMSEYFMTMGKLPASAADAGITTTVGTDLVDSIKVDKDGHLTVTLTKDKSLGDAGGKSIKLTLEDSSGGRLEYKCGPADGMAAKYLPANCRG